MTAKLIEGLELAKACALAADQIQAEDIRVWDLQGISSVTDFLVVCSGNSMPHLRAVLRDVEGYVFEWHGVRPANAEGNVESLWVVLDFIDVMVHVMHAETREHYGLERLWGDAKEVEWQRATASVTRQVAGVKFKPKAAKEPVLTKPRPAKKTAAKTTAAKKTATKKVAAKKAAVKKAAAKKSPR